MEVSEDATVAVIVRPSSEESRAVIKGEAIERIVTLPVDGARRRSSAVTSSASIVVRQQGKTLASAKLVADSDVATVAPAPAPSLEPTPVPLETAAQASGPTLWERLAGFPRRVLVALASPL